jgi:hypothetical protein
MFSIYKKVDRENTYMRNSLTSKVLSVGQVIPKMISEKFLTFNNVLHVTGIRKILMHGSLLCKNDFKMAF